MILWRSEGLKKQKRELLKYHNLKNCTPIQFLSKGSTYSPWLCLCKMEFIDIYIHLSTLLMILKILTNEYAYNDNNHIIPTKTYLMVLLKNTTKILKQNNAFD